MFLTAFYVGIIQIVLFLMTFVILFCELTKVFADTVKSVILRTTVAFALLTLGFYAHYLEYLPYPVVVSLFVITLAACFWTSKFIFKEYIKRKRKQDRLERIIEIRSNKNVT